METIQTNNLSFYNDQGILTLNAKQYDTGRKFVFYILDNDAPFDLTGCSVYLRVLKADGTQFQGEECCIIDNNTVTIDTSVSNGNQILTAEGQNQCELHLTDKDGKMLTTWEFIIHVQKRVHNGDNIVSTDSWDLMDYIENTAKDFNEKLENHYFVLTMDKDTAGGVTSLDADGKVPLDELYEATTTSKGITQLTDSITSTSTATAATPNSVKTAYEKLDNSKAPLTSPTLTGTPKAPTAPVGTNTTQLATTAFVQTAVSNGIAASDAMIIKGTIGVTGTVTALPTTYKTGWTYRVVSAGTYAGQVCEIGDLIIALVDRDDSDNADSDWCVAQTNINGAITGVKSGDAFIQTSQSGSVVTITHKDVTRTNTTSTAAPSHGGTFTAVKSVTSDSKGHVTGVDTETITLPQNYTHPTTSGSKHIPSGGSSGQILKWSADGTAVWEDADGITGIKGNAETTYRTGNVNLTAANIGAVNKAGDTMSGSLTINTTNIETEARANLERGDRAGRLVVSSAGNFGVYDTTYSKWLLKSDSDGNTNMYGNATSATQDGNGNVITDTYVKKSGDTVTGDLTCLGMIKGEDYYTNHALLMGHAQQDYWNFYEAGGIYNFYKSVNGSNTLLACITSGMEANTKVANGYPFSSFSIYHAYANAFKSLYYNSGLNFSSTYTNTDFDILGTQIELLAGSIRSSITSENDYNYHDGVILITPGGIDPINNLDVLGKITIQHNYGDIEITTINNGSLYLRLDSLIYTRNNIVPEYNNACTLGESNKKWSAVYTVNGTIQTSDRNAKNTIEELKNEQAQALIYGLRPSTYKMNDGTSGRTHWGMISQDIEELLEELGWTSLDFAGFIKSPKIKETRTITDENGKKTKVHEYIEGEYNYSLRYDEFIAPLIKVVQSQHEEIEDLKQRLNTLEQSLSYLKQNQY